MCSGALLFFANFYFCPKNLIILFSMNYDKKSLEVHEKKRGKIEIKSKVPLKTKNDLSVAYTPGVGVVSLAISKNKNKSWTFTNRANQVAIVSDGSAVLG